MHSSIYSEFINIFNKKHHFEFFAPGRVNLIGEHIDYNGGLVFPCAITFGTRLLMAPNDDNVLRFKTLNFNDSKDFPLQTSYKKEGKNWYYYPIGMIQEFLQKGFKLEQGYDLLYMGNIPIGSGLSSSASIEMATAFAFNSILNAQFSLLDLVKMAKNVENHFIGVNSGIMDQFAVSFGQKHKAIVLNCDTLDYELVDCNLGDCVLAIINTNKPRSLADSKYNERVAECKSALEQIHSVKPIQYLCELSEDEFHAHKHVISNPVVKNRAEHVVLENQRVHEAKNALNAGDLTKFGELMYASHDSLQHLYEVSGKELDTVVDFCKKQSYIKGARMTGAGFGGCAIALVQKGFEQEFTDALTLEYSALIGYAPSVYFSEIGDGVHEVK